MFMRSKTAFGGYFLRWGFLTARFADLELGGGFVVSIFRKPRVSMAIAARDIIRFDFTCHDFSTFLLPSKPKIRNHKYPKHIRLECFI